LLYLTINSRNIKRCIVWVLAVAAAAILLCLWALDARNSHAVSSGDVSLSDNTTDTPPVFTVVTPTQLADTPEEPSAGFSADEQAVPAHVNLSPFTINEAVFLPLTSAKVTSAFGFRDHPIDGEYRFHSGLDLAAPEGTPIYAMLGGEVVKAKFADDYGNYIILDHGDFQTLYAHCLTLCVEAGQQVEKGQQIALVGSTGSATGSHLHVEFRSGGQRFDPSVILGDSYQ